MAIKKSENVKKKDKALDKKKKKEDTKKAKLIINKNVKSVNDNATKVKNDEDLFNKKIIMFVLTISVIIAISIFSALQVVKERDESVRSVNNLEELNNISGVNVKEPANADNLKYSIENGEIARIDYNKKTDSGEKMNFILRSSSALEDINTYKEMNWGTDMFMTVSCPDDIEISVTANICIDNNKIMKGEWYDNDLYYIMTTDNLSTREEFLREIQDVIIDNHINSY